MRTQPIDSAYALGLERFHAG